MPEQLDPISAYKGGGRADAGSSIREQATRPTESIKPMREVETHHFDSGLSSTVPHSVVLTEGMGPFHVASPKSPGFVLTDNGPDVDPSFKAPTTGGGYTIVASHVEASNRDFFPGLVGIFTTQLNGFFMGEFMKFRKAIGILDFGGGNDSTTSWVSMFNNAPLDPALGESRWLLTVAPFAVVDAAATATSLANASGLFAAYFTFFNSDGSEVVSIDTHEAIDSDDNTAGRDFQFLSRPDAYTVVSGINGTLVPTTLNTPVACVHLKPKTEWVNPSGHPSVTFNLKCVSSTEGALQLYDGTGNPEQSNTSSTFRDNTTAIYQLLAIGVNSFS